MARVIGDMIGGIYTSETMGYTVTICATCGREFNRYPGHIYKKSHSVQGKVSMDWYCRPSCWPADGLLNDKKYDDKKIRQQVQKSEKEHKEKYYDARARYREAHREEINAKQNLRYTAGTTEAEARRLERNRKSNEKRYQKYIEKQKKELPLVKENK